ncbi:MAG: beta-ketoacyl synthase chain length factor [Bacteroidales bacterium]|nr:beta-ketoacyl synthase chain length factor [Bacteroidales bacterium]
MTDIYIKGIGNISPQKTIDNSGFPDEVMEYPDAEYLKCIEPVYKKYIEPMASRRMSRVVKMGLYSAKTCLDEADIEKPDAIITGTGLGCVEDTEKFLTSIIQNEEKLLNPTPFIQSTHNTISAQISLFLKCHGYNYTYAHRGFSFESALLDSILMFNEKSANTILLGGVDEITENTYQITKRLGHWKRENINHLKLLEYKTKGSIAGEGSAFFLLTNQPDKANYAKISSVHAFYKPENSGIIKNEIISFLSKNNLRVEDIDVAILGLNGDKNFDEIYYKLTEEIFKNTVCAYFKHLCGEYHTASSFAMYTAANILKNQFVPDVIKFNNKPQRQYKNILIYNHYRNINHSLLLLQNA